ncbi:MAG: hypothetical protein ACKVQW_03955 [Pyrinomonadaceae bacterium]
MAEEMEKLEPTDRSIPYEPLVESDLKETVHSLVESVEEVAESAEHLPTAHDPEHVQTTLGFERIELESTHLNLLASEMSSEELKHWVEVKFPALDDALENGISPSIILKLFRAKSDKAIENGVKGKELYYEDLRFASAYLAHQLIQPETRLRHFNERYRDYAQMLDRCQSRQEVIQASSKIRIDNASAGLQRQENGQDRDTRNSPALTSNEMQMLFTEQSPRHFTSEMIIAKLNYAGDGAATKGRVDALKRGEIAPSPEAQQLVDSLESRMGRKYLDESLSATKHFLQSLKTPNDELRYKNSFDHSGLYRKLPPAERDFVYELATGQKDRLETTVKNTREGIQGQVSNESDANKTDFHVEKLQEAMKTELLALSMSNADPEIVKERTGRVLNDHLPSIGLVQTDKSAMHALKNDLNEVLRLATSFKLPQRANLHGTAPTSAENTVRNEGNIIQPQFIR